jgi:pilus assembly protein CpaB
MVMSPVRMGVLVSVSLVAAMGLALVARSIASGHERKAPVTAAAPAQVEKPMARVLVAKHDLNPGDKLTAADFTWQPWPIEGLNPLFITDGPTPTPASPKAPMAVKIETAAVNAAADKAHDMIASDSGPAAKMVDAIVREPMLQGEPIIESKVVHAGAGGVMAVELDPGMRGMAVPLSAESAAGGFILPGDHVDVVQSRQVDVPGGVKKFASGAVLRNVKVLAIDQNTARTQKGAAVVGATATLEVTPEEAELLALSKSEGELTLILRSYADTAGASSAAGGARVAQDVNVAPTVVKVFRNGAPSDVAVAR